MTAVVAAALPHVPPALPPIDDRVKRIMAYLTSRGTFSQISFNCRHLTNLLFSADPQLLFDFRREIQKILAGLSVPGDEMEEAFVGNLIAMIPFTYPQVGDKFTIPLRGGRFNYTITTQIDLTPSWFSAPLSAYGFTSTDEGAPPLLSIIGTPQPGGEGYIAGLVADATPFLSVGHAPYLCGHTAIAAWLEANPLAARLYGASLGGAICLHILRNHAPRIARADLYNPPGLYWWDTYGENLPPTNIYLQSGDPISSFGLFPDHATIYHVTPPATGCCIGAHIRAHTGNRATRMLSYNTAQENRGILRNTLTTAHLFLAPAFFLLFLSLYLVSKIIRLVTYIFVCCSSPQSAIPLLI